MTMKEQTNEDLSTDLDRIKSFLELQGEPVFETFVNEIIALSQKMRFPHDVQSYLLEMDSSLETNYGMKYTMQFHLIYNQSEYEKTIKQEQITRDLSFKNYMKRLEDSKKVNQLCDELSKVKEQFMIIKDILKLQTRLIELSFSSKKEIQRKNSD